MNKTVLKVIRVSLLVLALINTVLTMIGVSPIDLDSEVVTNVINGGAIIVTALWNTWKNCSVTRPHLEADKVAEAIKEGAEIVIQYRYGAESDYGFEPEEDDGDYDEYEEAEEMEVEE